MFQDLQLYRRPQRQNQPKLAQTKLFQRNLLICVSSRSFLSNYLTVGELYEKCFVIPFLKLFFVFLALHPAAEKLLPQAKVRPNVLTHVIDGFVIQEAAEPFAVSILNYRHEDIVICRFFKNILILGEQAFA